MKYFVKIKRHGKIMHPFFGHFSSLSEADIIARHESREPDTNLVQVIDDKNVVRRSYKSGEVGAEYKGNPSKRKSSKIIAKTRNKNIKPIKKYYLMHAHKQGTLYFDGVGFSKLKSSAAFFLTVKAASERGKQIADMFNVPVKVMGD